MAACSIIGMVDLNAVGECREVFDEETDNSILISSFVGVVDVEGVTR